MIYPHIFSLLFFTLTILNISASAHCSELSGGAQIVSLYKQDLQKALRSGMSEGVMDAISACRIKAPKIAESLSKDGVRIGRASHRLRNPGNAPPDWVNPIMDAYIAMPADLEPRNVSLPENRSGYVEAIVLQPLCVACHGEALATEVAARINELYPEDRATGFRVGDLRGVFWVEYPTEK